MSNTEFKARALYDFVAEGSNELSFSANEILTITSSTAGHGWWYAKNSSGRMGVIPENYVQALADPPEPNEPPPAMSTFSHTNNNYPNLDVFGSNNNTAKSSYSPPAYDQHQYMNPGTYTNNWQAQDTSAWASSPPLPPPQLTNSNRQISKKDTDSDDSFSDSEYPTAPSNTTNFNTLPVHSTLSSQVRSSIVGGETSKSAPRARFFDKHGLDSYLLNGGKGKSPDEHVEITYDDREGGVCWSPNPGMPPFTCKIEEPSKGTKLGGLKAFTEYKISPQIHGKQPVNRRYKQFDWLHEQLVNKYRFLSIPPLPGKQIAGRFEQDFIKERQRLLELWLNRVCRHPVLCASFPVQHFITCDGSDKNKKEWKGGKRKIEKDEFRDASWLQCVTVRDTRIAEDELHSQIDAFVHQQPGLESQFRNLSQGLTKYTERYTDTYERDIQKIGELFSKVHLAVQIDKTTPGNQELSNSINKISRSYNDIAESYKTKGSEGLRNFNERIQEYIGLLGCFPSILGIQKSASDFMKTVQQRGIDASDAARRYHDLNHVVLAEINFFQKQKVIDLNEYLQEVVDEQTNFYGEIAAKLREVTFNAK
ncbi:unnamed protein product [Adineta ricciae]|uniref:Sorting nexin n=1 Tax=Adineta ricciae TaxID=249248 RepID=A0A814BET2_ADIRI|nr:unnamed protein product [Adineta ricciae]